MRPRLTGIFFSSCLAIHMASAAGISEAGARNIVIDHVPASTQIYVGSPSIAIMPDGSYVASHDYFGRGSSDDTTIVFSSHDRGQSWRMIATIKGQWWSTLFVLHGELYLMGTSRENGKVVIRRSGDGGQSWTEPVNSETGLLLAQGKYSCAPGAVVVHNGRIWRAMEENLTVKMSGKHHRAFMMSAPVNADLLNAFNWTISDSIASDPAWLEGEFGGWLEGNAVVAPNGQVVDVLRAHCTTGTEKAAIVHISADGRTITFDPKHDFVEFPGGSKKFSIRFDSVSRLYWALVNPVPATASSGFDDIRNTLALASSPDLVKWTVRSIVLHHPDVHKHAYQYADWLFDADDIVAVVRTADDDSFGGAHTFHDANYFTFLRVEHFRNLNMSAPATAPILETRDLSISGSGFTIYTLASGKPAFSNRKYVWRGIPEQYSGWRYTKTSGGLNPKITVRAKHDAMLQIVSAVDQPGFNLSGWEQAGVEFHYSDEKNTRMVLFQRRLPSGGEINIPQGNWTGSLVLLPAFEDASAQTTNPNAFTNTTTNPPPLALPARTISQAEASFITAVTNAFAKHDADALVAITCWDHAPEKLKNSGRQQYLGIVSAAGPPIKDLKLLDPKHPGPDWNVDDDPRFAEIDPAWKKSGVVYHANLQVVKQLKITFAPAKAGDKTPLTITVTYPVGDKGGKLYFIEPVPFDKEVIIDTRFINLHLHRLLVILPIVSALGVLGVAGWVGFCAFLRWQIDWKALTRRFPTGEVQKLGEKYSSQSGLFVRKSWRWFSSIKSMFTVELARQGVLVTAGFARNAPLLIPWSDIFKVDQLTLFGSEKIFISARYDQEIAGQKSLVQFSLPAAALATVMGNVPAELLQQTSSFSEVIRNRLNKFQNPSNDV
jgi:hypothetical protein